MEIKTTKTISNEYYEDDNTIGANPNPYKKWVAVDDEQKRIDELENKRNTDNNDYINFNITDWVIFRNELKGEK